MKIYVDDDRLRIEDEIWHVLYCVVIWLEKFVPYV